MASSIWMAPAAGGVATLGDGLTRWAGCVLVGRVERERGEVVTAGWRELRGGGCVRRALSHAPTHPPDYSRPLEEERGSQQRQGPRLCPSSARARRRPGCRRGRRGEGRHLQKCWSRLPRAPGACPFGWCVCVCVCVCGGRNECVCPLSAQPVYAGLVGMDRRGKGLGGREGKGAFLGEGRMRRGRKEKKMPPLPRPRARHRPESGLRHSADTLPLSRSP